ncbi:MAG: acetate/propionate family kinase, partial [Candidatus Thermochlorobacter sp.]
EDAQLTHRTDDGRQVRLQQGMPDHAAGLDWILSLLTHPEHGSLASLEELDAVGHRVVHAGERYTGSVLVTEDVIAALEECIELAPLHNPPNLAGIYACRERLPHTPMVCVFDNALHATLPPGARFYGLPYEFYERYGIRRYGFHGIAFRSILEQVEQWTGRPLKELRVVSLMLGSGSTANAMRYGESVEVSTGFTPLEGLLQSTRSGDLDPAVVTYLMERESLTPKEMTDLLNRRSGLLGLSGVSNDLRDIQQAAAQGNPRAQLALEVYAHRCKKYIGAYLAALGGAQAITFTGGIGENSDYIRAKICSHLEWFGLELDEAKNSEMVGGKEGMISKPESSLAAWVIPTNEELIIARDTYRAIVPEPVA